MAKKAATFDPRSDEVVLYYAGGDDGVPALGGIPARDLTQADIARLVYAQAVTAYDGTEAGGPMPDPTEPDQAKCDELVELLLEREVDGGRVYRKTPPKKDDEPAEPAAAPAEAPAEPEADQ